MGLAAKAKMGLIRYYLLKTHNIPKYLFCFYYSPDGIIRLHASASPLEGLGEKKNWLHQSIESDPLGVALLQQGIDVSTISSWCRDPSVILEIKDPASESVWGGIFDELEDTDIEECIAKCLKIFNNTTRAASLNK